jgi:hypothetical protein
VFLSGTWIRRGGSGIHNCERTAHSDTIKPVQAQRTAPRKASQWPTMQELRDFGLHNGDLSGISGDERYSPDPRARNQLREGACL